MHVTFFQLTAWEIFFVRNEPQWFMIGIYLKSTSSKTTCTRTHKIIFHILPEHTKIFKTKPQTKKQYGICQFFKSYQLWGQWS